jgi:hypothetical protein
MLLLIFSIQSKGGRPYTVAVAWANSKGENPKQCVSGLVVCFRSVSGSKEKHAKSDEWNA